MRRPILFPVLLLFVAVPLFAAADREASRAAIIIPVAGTVPGANGTFFQTDLTLTNRTISAQPLLVDVFWLPRDVRGTGAPVTRLTLSPGAINFYEDFVTRTLHQQGIGSIVLRAVNADGSANQAGRIDAFARIWTPVPGGAGTTSQSVHASTLYQIPSDDLQPIAGMIYGLRQDTNFRSNYGIVNLTADRQTYSVSFLTNGRTHTETVSVEGNSMTHRPVPASETGPLTIAITVGWCGICGATPLPTYVAYGSSIDNHSGDAWYSKAQAAYPHNEPR